MKINKRILDLCRVLQILFIAFFIWILLDFLHMTRDERELMAFFGLVMLGLAILGEALTLALWDYCKNVMQSASIDVAGIHNRKSLEKKLAQLEDKEDTLNVGIMMFDLNNLKLVNDTYGHEEGDVFIRNFASLLTRILNENSFLARFGGDEFLIVQEHTSLEELERLNGRLEEAVQQYNETAVHPISYAVGYEVSYKNHYYLIKDLLKIADARMYRDKVQKKSKLGQVSRCAMGEEKMLQSITAEALSRKVFTLLNSAAEDGHYAFVMMDVREFHLINDYWGFAVGNEILKRILCCLQHLDGVIFADRFHSDVFVCMADCTQESQDGFVERFAAFKQKITDQISSEYPIQYFCLNAGVCFVEDKDEQPEKIISHANSARRKAAEQKQGICVFTRQVEAEELLRADVLHSFQNALEKEEFILYFQPKISGKSQKITSAEVLVRWKRADETFWVPDSFIPVLEETGEIDTLDFYVYEKAFQWMKKQKEDGTAPVVLSLNVSPSHFKHIEKFTDQVLRLIRQYEIDTAYLIFEITESAYIHNVEAVNQMIRIFHKHGIRISMDDFGSGYSSLNSLKEIMFDEIKIDKKFLGDSLSENGRIVLQEIFHLLKRTKKTIVCEGVETKETADFLIKEGCDELQGYFYYRPMPMEKFEELMQGE